MRKISGIILFLLVFVLLAVPTAGVVLAQSGAPTAEPMAWEPQETASLPWYVGVTILLVIFVGVTVFKNRMQASRKKPVVTVSSCAPVYEDGTAPFHPIEDANETKS